VRLCVSCTMYALFHGPAHVLSALEGSEIAKVFQLCTGFPCRRMRAPYQECEKAAHSSHIRLKTFRCDHDCPVSLAFKSVINGGRESFRRHVEFYSATNLLRSRRDSSWGSDSRCVTHVLLSPTVHWIVHRLPCTEPDDYVPQVVTPILLTFILILYFVIFCDRLCGLVVRVPGYRSRKTGSILGATTFSEK
jgi:hypothetical protein